MKTSSKRHQTIKPQISIIIVAYNSKTDLETCLPSLEKQNINHLETIIIDNQADPQLKQWLNNHHPSVSYYPNTDNDGYAGGSNRGIQLANADTILILNPDTELHDNALQTLINAINTNPHALINPKLLKPDGTINACGNQMHYTGITTCTGINQPSQNYTGTFPIPLLSGAAIIAKKQTLQKLNGFNEIYWMYVEDTDLSLRARMHNHPLLCAADAVITHHYKLNMTASKFHYLERNRLLTLLTTYQRKTLKQIAFALTLTEIATWIYALMKGPTYLKARYNGYAWLWKNKKTWLKTRKTLQQTRTISDTTLLQGSLNTLPFEQLLPNKTIASWLNTLTKPFYQLSQPKLAKQPAKL